MGLIKKIPSSERPREKAFLYGIESLTDVELLAVILSTGSKNKDVIELSQEIMNNSLSLTNLSNMSLQELSMIDGIKKVKALKIKASFELNRRINIEKEKKNKCIKTIDEAALFFKSNINDNIQERLQILMLSDKNIVKGYRSLSVGTGDMVPLSTNLIITSAMKCYAKKIIIAHNHPSNVCFPSEADKEATERLMFCCGLMGIILIDHLIITNNSFYSIIKEKEFFYF